MSKRTKKKNKRKNKQKIIKKSRSQNIVRGKNNINKSITQKSAKKSKISIPVVICATVNFIIFAHTAFNDETIDYGPIGFACFILFLLVLSFGIWTGIGFIFKALFLGEPVTNKPNVISDEVKKHNTNLNAVDTAKLQKVNNPYFSQELIKQLNGITSDEIKKTATDVFKMNGKADAFKYIRERGYGLTQAKSLVDNIEKELMGYKKPYAIEGRSDGFNIDGMEGHEFEHWCADLLKKSGFNKVEVTPASNDQGVDILADKDGIKYAFQCKNYSTPLGNTPVQEVGAGKVYYKCHVGVVMTNSTFTKGAIELAKATGVLLWDGNTIEKMFSNVNIYK